MKTFVVVLAILAIALAHPHSLLVKKNTPENLRKLENPNPTENVELLGGQTEGDMVLTVDQMSALYGKTPRVGLIDTRYRWPSNTVPYIISSEFDAAQQQAIRAGLDKIEQATCLRFVPRVASEHPDYVAVIGEDGGCWSYVGRSGGRQELNLQRYVPGSGCFREGTIIHEFIHSLGFYHMQSAHDRDDYVDIIWENIQPGTENNFAKHEANRVSHFGVGYDYGSVMHYSATAFSINGQRTIVTLDPTAEIGQRDGMSDKDIARINAMYNC